MIINRCDIFKKVVDILKYIMLLRRSHEEPSKTVVQYYFNNIICYVEWIMEIIVVKEGLDNLLRRLEHN